MSNGGIERRRAKRRVILDSFSLFATVQKKGDFRLKVEDLSDVGIGFFLDEEGESHEQFPVKEGETLDMNLYLNQSLFLPLMVKVVRISEKNAVRRIGAEFEEKAAPSFKAFLSFLVMLDTLIGSAQLKKT